MPAGNGVSSTRWPLDTDWFLSCAGIQATDGLTPPPSDKWGTGGQVCQRQVFVSRWGHQTVVHLLASFFYVSISLLSLLNPVCLVRSLSPSVPIFVPLSLFCPPALRSCLMTYMFFWAVRLAAVSRSTEPLASAWQPRWPVTHTAPLVLHWPIRAAADSSPSNTSTSRTSRCLLYSLDCSKYEIGWQSHVFHCFRGSYPLFSFCFSSCHCCYKVEAKEAEVWPETWDHCRLVEWVWSALWWTQWACGYANQSTPT